MKKLLSLPILLLVWLASCRQMTVIDDLYDIDVEQGYLSLQVRYTEYAPEMYDSLPASYLFDLQSQTEYPSSLVLIDNQGLPVSDLVNHPLDLLAYEGYVQPGHYHLLTYSAPYGYTRDSAILQVAPAGDFILRHPAPLFCGTWDRDIQGGDRLNDSIVVRQHTRQVVFRILMQLGDSIRYESSDVRLTDIPYRFNLDSATVERDYLSPLSLDMHLEMYRGEDGVVYPALVDTLNILAPTAAQYADWSLSSTLSVRINFLYYLNGVPHKVAPIDCSFADILAPAYSAEYADRENDPYCIKRFVWQAHDTLTFHSVLDTVSSGNIVPWDIVSDFGKL